MKDTYDFTYAQDLRHFIGLLLDDYCPTQLKIFDSDIVYDVIKDLKQFKMELTGNRIFGDCCLECNALLNKDLEQLKEDLSYTDMDELSEEEKEIVKEFLDSYKGNYNLIEFDCNGQCSTIWIRDNLTDSELEACQIIDKHFDVFKNLEDRVDIELFGIRKKGYIEDILETVGLEGVGKKKTKHFSLGMKQRLGIGLALVGEPDLLVLDEPINGLDPQGIAEVRDTIQRLRDERNMTILISSHILEELSKIATDYGIIHNGSLLQELTSEELMKRCSERIEIELIHPEQAVPILDRMGFTNYQVTDKSHIHIFERLNESANVNMELAKAGILVNGISITSEELETYFLNLTGGIDHA